MTENEKIKPEDEQAVKELDSLLNDDGSLTNLTLSDSEYDGLILAIKERNRLSDLISDIICRSYKERSL